MMPRSVLKTLPLSLAKIIFGAVLALVIGEGVVRLTAASGDNYIIEMWRYGTQLKRPTASLLPGHEHIPGRAADLQKVHVRINAMGLRGPEIDPSVLARNAVVVLLGDSVTFGWGVAEDQTLSAQLAARLGPDVTVLNAGIGNMNLEQLAAHWDNLSQTLRPDLLVLLPTIRAAEPYQREHVSWLVRHSELAAVASVFVRQLTSGATGREDLVAAYRRHWSEGGGAISAGLDDLARHQQAEGYPILVAMVPETHDFVHYPFGFVTELMRKAAADRHWRFLDLFAEFQGEKAERFWVAPQDVHPNGEAFAKMAVPLAAAIKDELGHRAALPASPRF